MDELPPFSYLYKSNIVAGWTPYKPAKLGEHIELCQEHIQKCEDMIKRMQGMRFLPCMDLLSPKRQYINIYIFIRL